jgi:GTP-binding protein HflX
MQTTLTVLGELGADEKEILTVFNKIDLLKKDDLENLKFSQNYKPGDAVFLSCRTEQGIPNLLQVIEKKLGLHRELRSYLIPHEEYKLVVKIRKEGCLAEESSVNEGIIIKAYPSTRLRKDLTQYEI